VSENPKIQPYESATEIGHRWGVHRTTAMRTLQRYGVSGRKFGKSQQSGRRYPPHEVHEVEKLLCLNAGKQPSRSSAKKR
jgi:hypothetical protein